ncbi:Outer membrane efflux protein [Crateriforma conspicua]|uniref:Outer membrane efflux protein n=1 Tax=Crateriforma conspicua TaxID=2527996 RepID=A0A5C6FK80_9PLAN|nr:TolC family protein [Crateriforma conspicua]TWU61704.1 Outer membrane efflux protein [Crateriforma conspicua]
MSDTTSPHSSADASTKRRSRRFERKRALVAAMVIGTVVQSIGGCGVFRHLPDGPHDTKTSYHDNSALRIEYPEVAQCATPTSQAARAASAPVTLEDPSKIPALEMTLDEAIRRAISQSPVLRRTGTNAVVSPQSVSTVYDPAMAHSDPFSGVEAALAAFDAQYAQTLSWNKVDTPNNVDPNNPIAIQFSPLALQATQSVFSNELSKRTAQGASFALRHNVNYDRNNRPFNFLRSSFIGYFEAEYRQPLMRGAGTQFNRIVGNGSVPGQYNGVLIARVNEDVSLAEFERNVIGVVSDVEAAYWNLATAYRVLEANLKGRESALQTLQFQQVRLEVGTGRRDEEAQARSQYYQFDAQVQNALGGTQGLYELERELRYLIGMPASDGTLIRPTTDPIDVRVTFDWNSALSQALQRRVEIRRQRLQVKRREMELYAARLNKRPQLDFLGIYRVRGLGDHLIGSEGHGSLDNLYGEITGGQFEEWQMGMELSLPVGLRAASAAIANAKLTLQRERALLADAELRVSHELTAATRALDVTYQLVETNYNRYLADLRQVEVLRRRYLDGTDNINFLLQAQRQVVTSEQQFYQALAAYNLAIRDVHGNKGSLLAYNQIQLGEGPWCPDAYRDAYEVGRFLKPRHQPEKVHVPRPVSSGPFDPSAIQSTGMPVTSEVYQSMPPSEGGNEGPVKKDDDGIMPAPKDDPEDNKTGENETVAGVVPILVPDVRR